MNGHCYTCGRLVSDGEAKVCPRPYCDAKKVVERERVAKQKAVWKVERDRPEIPEAYDSWAPVP